MSNTKKIEKSIAPNIAKGYEINKEACKFFQSILKEANNEGTKYLANRGITMELINDFSLGMGSDKVIKYLKKLGYSHDEMNKYGITHIDNGNIKCVFNNRIVIPIKNKGGDILTFLSRSIGEGEKYIIGKNTKLFYRGDAIYNLDKAHKIANKLKEIIIVEGCFDVILLKKIGIKNVVSIMGNNMNDYVINQLRKYKKLLLFLDPDKPGREGTIRIGKSLEEKGIKVEMVLNNTDLDPAELVLKKSEDILKSRVDLKMFKINHYYKVINNKSDLHSVNSFLKRVKPIANKEYIYVKFIAQLLKVKIKEISDKVWLM